MTTDEHDYVPNDKLGIPDEVPDFGQVLRQLRENHGYTCPRLSKVIGIPPKYISDIELCKKDLPPENVLRHWLHTLGCGRINVQKLILISRQYRVKHWFKLNRGETANPDILRLLQRYRDEALTDYDRSILRLVARK
jgi:transcriptional regulator with XRE-family HTH domain